jgi:hypothetical protein
LWQKRKEEQQELRIEQISKQALPIDRHQGRADAAVNASDDAAPNPSSPIRPAV